ncbi:MAG TPA: hypothetical protein VN408_26865 [Actinoplanes sp.]|nr:hypothetical protein [Actinoplanes sp.]
MNAVSEARRVTGEHLVRRGGVLDQILALPGYATASPRPAAVTRKPAERLDVQPDPAGSAAVSELDLVTALSARNDASADANARPLIALQWAGVVAPAVAACDPLNG